jgi:hypothetical protein
MAKESSTNNDDGGHIFKSNKTNEGFDSVRKNFDGGFRQAYQLPAFIDCSVEQLCNMKAFNNFATYLKTIKQKNERPSLFNVENKDDFNEHCKMLTTYLKRTATKEAWATGENAEKTVPAAGRTIINACCRMLLQDCVHPGAGPFSNPHTLRLLMSKAHAGAGRATEGANSSYKGTQLDQDNGPVVEKWKEDKLALEKPMMHVPDALSYWMCVIHSWASYLVLGPEEDPDLPLITTSCITEQHVFTNT